MKKIWLLLWCLSFGTVLRAETVLTLYTYHNMPPFVVNAQSKTGLNYDLVQALQQKLAPDYQLELQIVARPELNQRLTQGQPTIILWANPAWFSQIQQKLVWSPVLFTDREVFVSRLNNSKKINQLNDLAGMRLGAMRGYRYPDLEPLLASGQVTRVDGDNDLENLSNLLAGHTDQVVITRSSMVYYGRQQQFLGKLTVTGLPYPPYSRQILLTPHYRELHSKLDQAVLEVVESEHWQQRLELYGLHRQ